MRGLRRAAWANIIPALWLGVASSEVVQLFDGGLHPVAAVEVIFAGKASSSWLSEDIIISNLPPKENVALAARGFFVVSDSENAAASKSVGQRVGAQYTPYWESPAYQGYVATAAFMPAFERASDSLHAPENGWRSSVVFKEKLNGCPHSPNFYAALDTTISHQNSLGVSAQKYISALQNWQGFGGGLSSFRGRFRSDNGAQRVNPLLFCRVAQTGSFSEQAGSRAIKSPSVESQQGVKKHKEPISSL